MWRKRALCPGQPAPGGASPGVGGSPTTENSEENILMENQNVVPLKSYHIGLLMYNNNKKNSM